MVYILERGIRLKRWAGGWACCATGRSRKPIPLKTEDFALLKSCDGMTDLPASDALYAWEAMGVIRRCGKGEACLAEGQIREYPTRLPCVISWEITERCNYNCLHCFNAADNEIQRNEFTREEAFRFLKEAADCGVLGIWLTGGEPTLYPWFREVVAEIRKQGLSLATLLTNGSLLDGEMAGFISELHPRAEIMLSFDGIGTHDWLRRHKGSEEDVKRAIRASKAAGLRVRINMNVNRRNRAVIEDSVRMLADLGADHIRIIKTTETPRWQLNAADTSLTPEEYYDFSIGFAKWYRKSGLTLPVVIWQSLFLRGSDQAYHILPVKGPRHAFRENVSICPAMMRKPSLRANGDLIPCSPMGGFFASKGIRMGNVKQEGLQKLLTEGKLYEQATLTLKDKQQANLRCAGCRYFPYCHGGCPALGWLYHDNPLGPDEHKCIFFRGGYFGKYSEALRGWKDLLSLTEAETQELME